MELHTATALEIINELRLWMNVRGDEIKILDIVKKKSCPQIQNISSPVIFSSAKDPKSFFTSLHSPSPK